MPKMMVAQGQRLDWGKKRYLAGEVVDIDNAKVAELFEKTGRAQLLNLETPAEVEFEAPAKASRREPLTEEVEAKPAAPLYKTRHLEAEKLPSHPPPLKKRGRPAGKAKRSQS